MKCLGVSGALLAALLLGCGAGTTPEAEVRAALAALEAAAEAGDAGAFTELVSVEYEDPYGHDREGLRAFVAFHVMRSGRGREVIVRVRDLRIEPGAPPRAAVTLAVGLAGSGRGPGRLGAEVYAVDLDLVREDAAWRVSWAQWRPAPATDLLQLSSPSTFVTDASPVGLEEAAGDQSPLRLQESGDAACAGTGLRRPEFGLDLSGDAKQPGPGSRLDV